MKILKAKAAITFSIGLLMLPFLARATDLNDIANSNQPPGKPDVVVPYTLQDIINHLPATLDNEQRFQNPFFRFYSDKAFNFHDPRVKAFDEENFGKCIGFYLENGSFGGRLFEDTVMFLFPKDEQWKEKARKRIKDALTKTDSPSQMNLERDGTCENWRNNVIRLKEILDAVIQAAPEVPHIIAMDKEEKQKAARDAEEKRVKAVSSNTTTRPASNAVQDNVPAAQQDTATPESAPMPVSEPVAAVPVQKAVTYQPVPEAEAPTAETAAVSVQQAATTESVNPIEEYWLIFKDRAVTWLIVIAIIGIGIAAYGYTNSCPSCKKWFAKKTIRTKIIGENSQWETINRTDTHKDSKGNKIGETHRKELVNVTYRHYQHENKCKYCNYEWTSKSTSKSQ